MRQLKLDILNYEYEQLCQLYWEVNSESRFSFYLKEIAKITGIKSTLITNIVKESCAAYSNTTFCEKCGISRQLYDRNDYLDKYSINDWICCGCWEEEIKHISDLKKEKVFKYIESSKVLPINIDKLTLKETVYLLTLIRHSAKEDLTGFNALSDNIELIMPDPDSNSKLIKFLSNLKLISLSHDSPVEAFSFLGEEDVFISLSNSIWQLELNNGDNLSSFLSQIETLLSNDEFIQTNCADLYELMVDISFMECTAFLKYSLKEYNLDFSPGEKTKKIFLQMLETYSVAQIYNLIWSACKDAAAYSMKKGISKRHAANTVVNNIQKKYEHSVSELWNIKEFRRNYNLPQSILSQVVFNYILQTYDGGFNKKIHTFIEKSHQNKLR